MGTDSGFGHVICFAHRLMSNETIASLSISVWGSFFNPAETSSQSCSSNSFLNRNLQCYCTTEDPSRFSTGPEEGTINRGSGAGWGGLWEVRTHSGVWSDLCVYVCVSGSGNAQCWWSNICFWRIKYRGNFLSYFEKSRRLSNTET